MPDGHDSPDPLRAPAPAPEAAQTRATDPARDPGPDTAVRRPRTKLAVGVTAGAAAIVAALAVLTFIGGGPSAQSGRPAPVLGEPGDVPDDLMGQLASEITKVLEAASPTEHLHHGHGFASPGLDPVICAVEPFGLEPAGVSDIQQVTRVYARHICAVDDMNGSWEQSVRASGPIAVDMTGPLKVRVPESGQGYPERVRRLIPARYQTHALQNFADISAIEAARKRFDALPPRPVAPPV
jgi:hypothetical protein